MRHILCHILSRAEWIAFAVAAVACLITFGGRLKSADEIAVYSLAYNLAQRGALDIDVLASTAPGMSAPPFTGIGAFGLDGHFYSGKGILPSLLGAPMIKLALLVPGADPVIAALLLNVGMTALAAAVIARHLRRSGRSSTVACGCGVIYAVATMALAYGKSMFTEPAAAVCLALAFHLLTRPVKKPDLATLLAGLALGGAMAASYSNAVIAPCFAVLAIYTSRRNGERWRATAHRMVWLGAGISPWLAGLALYNLARFGSVMNTGLSLWEWSAPYFSAPAALVRTFGLVFSPYRGIVLYNPVLALTPIALMVAMKTRARSELIALSMAAGATVCYLVFFSFWSMWWGGFNWGPRFLLPVIPLWIIGLAPAFEWALGTSGSGAAARSGWRIAGRMAVGLAVLASTGVSLLGALTDIYPSEGALSRAGLMGGLVKPESLAASPLLTDLRYYQPAIALSQLASGDLDVWWRAPAAPDDSALRAALSDIAARATPNSTVVLMAPARTERVLHDYRLAAPLIGVAADQIDSTGDPPTRQLLSRARLLMLTDAGQTDPGNTTERWLEHNAFRARNEFRAPWRVAAFGVAARPALTRADGVNVAFGPKLQLASAEWTPVVARGGAVALIAQWRRSSITDTLDGLAWFAHLIGPDGKLVAQHDALIGDGYGWADGAILEDRRGILVPSDAPAGEYRVHIGVYDASGGRFPAVVGNGAAQSSPLPGGVYMLRVDIR